MQAMTAVSTEQKIVFAISQKPAWMPEIARTSGLTLIQTRNAVARMFHTGVIDITRQGFIAHASK